MANIQNIKIKDLPKVERPREKLEINSIDALTNTELLSILLGSGIRGRNVKKVSASLLKKFGKKLIDAKIEDLTKIKGIGKVKAVQIVSAFELAKRFILIDKSKITIKTADDVFDICKDWINKKKEHLIVLYLDSLNQLIKKEVIAIGTVDSNLVHPREIFAPAYLNNATAIILVHNHPVGNSQPTPEDIEITEKLIKSEEISGIKIIDHIIISKQGYFSFLNNYNQNKIIDYFKSGYKQIGLFDFYTYTQEEVEIDKTKKRYKDPSFDFKHIRQTDGIHGLHIYPAVMAYPIADYFIENYSEENNIVLDPFMGSGTTLVEANMKKRFSYGIDINPLAELITKVKLKSIEPLILRNELENILKRAKHPKPAIPEIKNISLWFKPSVIEELGKIRKAIWGIKDNEIQDFFKISFSETIRNVSNCRNGFKLHRYAEEDLRKHNPNVKEFFYKKSLGNIYKLNSMKGNISKRHWFKIVRNIKEIKDGEIDLIVTSPPYGDSKTTVAYGQFSRFSLEWLELDKINVDRESLGGKIIKNTVYDIYSELLFSTLENISFRDKKRADEVFAFFYDLNLYLKDFGRVVKPKGFMCMVVGNRTVKNIQIPTDEIIVELCKDNFMHHKTIIREIPNKRMPNKNSPTNIAGNTVNTMLEEYMVILERK